MLSVITSLEFFQHHFSEMGHRDLLVTQNLSQAIEQPTLHYLTRSVRRRAATSKRASSERSVRWAPQNSEPSVPVGARNVRGAPWDGVVPAADRLQHAYAASWSVPAHLDLLCSLSAPLTEHSLRWGNLLASTPKTSLAAGLLLCWRVRFGRVNRNPSTCAPESS